MLKVLCDLESITPVLFNGVIASPKDANETHDDWEDRVWRERCDCDSKGYLVLSSRRFKKGLDRAAQTMNIKIPGEGKATYTKNFKGGIIVMNSIRTNVTRDDVEALRLFTAPRKNDGRRWINFPIVKEWTGELQINILDEKITEEVFRKVFDFFGMAVGVGQGRPENGGDNGRCEALEMVFEKA